MRAWPSTAACRGGTTRRRRTRPRRPSGGRRSPPTPSLGRRSGTASILLPSDPATPTRTRTTPSTILTRIPADVAQRPRSVHQQHVLPMLQRLFWRHEGALLPPLPVMPRRARIRVRRHGRMCTKTGGYIYLPAPFCCRPPFSLQRCSSLALRPLTQGPAQPRELHKWARDEGLGEPLQRANRPRLPLLCVSREGVSPHAVTPRGLSLACCCCFIIPRAECSHTRASQD
jgi:hypothetical protein